MQIFSGCEKFKHIFNILPPDHRYIFRHLKTNFSVEINILNTLRFSNKIEKICLFGLLFRYNFCKAMRTAAIYRF